jgi:hypothetical protein
MFSGPPIVFHGGLLPPKVILPPNVYRSALVCRRMPTMLVVQGEDDDPTNQNMQRLIANLGRIRCIVQLNLISTADPPAHLQRLFSVDSVKHVLEGGGGGRRVAGAGRKQRQESELPRMSVPPLPRAEIGQVRHAGENAPAVRVEDGLLRLANRQRVQRCRSQRERTEVQRSTDVNVRQLAHTRAAGEDRLQHVRCSPLAAHVHPQGWGSREELFPDQRRVDRSVPRGGSSCDVRQIQLVQVGEHQLQPRFGERTHAARRGGLRIRLQHRGVIW